MRIPYNMDAPMTSVCVFVYTYTIMIVRTVTVNTKSPNLLQFMKRSIIRDSVDERYAHAIFNLPLVASLVTHCKVTFYGRMKKQSL